jgi:hypothetical protein
MGSRCSARSAPPSPCPTPSKPADPHSARPHQCARPPRTHPPPRPQLYVDKARLEEAQPGGFAQLKNQLDVGDIVGAAGSVKRTEKGELSVVPRSLQVRATCAGSGVPRARRCRRRRRRTALLP